MGQRRDRWWAVAVSFLDLLFLPTLQYPPFHRIFQNSSLYIFAEQNTKAGTREKKRFDVGAT